MGMSDIGSAGLGNKVGVVGVNTSEGVVEDVYVTSHAQHSTLATALMGENSTDDRLYGGNAPASKVALTATGVVKASAGKYYGYKVTTVLGAGAITVYDDPDSANGTVIDSIAATTAAGTTVILASPIPCSAGMYASFASTGTVLFLYT